jgi:hypothetical protein
MLIDPTQTSVLGPLSSFAAGFADELARQGYMPGTVDKLMGKRCGSHTLPLTCRI